MTSILPAGITEPGVYDLPDAVYHADPVPGGSLSASGAKKLLPPSCPAIFHYERTNPPKPKAAFDLGHAAHKLVLGVGPKIVRVEAKDWKTKAAQAQRDDAHAAGHVPLLAVDVDKVKAMAAALRAHPIASALLDPWRGGKAEQSLFWKDAGSGIQCRARLDFLRDRVVVDYKGLALDTPIPTPQGWATMASLSIGDQVFDSQGKVCQVVAKSEVHLRRCYRVRFDDASSVVCDDEHLWPTQSGYRASGTPVARTTEEIKSTLRHHSSGQRHHRIAVAAPLELPDVDLPVDPYVFGCWLGDGTTNEGTITKPDDELFELIGRRGYAYSELHGCGDRPRMTRTVYGLRKQLRLAGLLGHKVIPTQYLRAGYEQRLALLRGLMDTDGCWNPLRGQAIFSTTNKALGLAVRELACSLGQRAVMHQTTQHGFGVTVQAYPVTFTPVGLNPFSLSRKANLVPPADTPRPRGHKSTRRIVMAVEEMPTVPTQCITVDSPDRTYLCGDQMIPTHNTAAAVDLIAITKAIHTYNYHLSAAVYLDAVRALDLADDPEFVFVFQAKEPPYLVTVTRIDVDAERIGRDLWCRAVDIYVRCTDAGRWPDHHDGIAEVSLPTYAIRAHDQIEGQPR